MTVRPVTDADLDVILVLNNGAVPAVNELTRTALDWLAAHADRFLVVDGRDAEIAGFLIGLGPALAYDSSNYRWFAARYERFVYVDRVVVAPGIRRAGVGTALYDAYAAHGCATGASVLLAEVNIRPRNDESLRFHERHGFVPVGEQDTEDGAKRVTMLAKHLP